MALRSLPFVCTDFMYTEAEIQTVRTRGKARALARLCVECNDRSTCILGCKLVRIHQEVCAPQTGNDFQRCASCSHTIDGTCAIDKASLAEELHEQLAVCTAKRRFDMPFILLRWDVLFGKKCGSELAELP